MAWANIRNAPMSSWSATRVSRSWRLRVGRRLWFYHVQRLFRLRKTSCVPWGLRRRATLEPSLTCLAFKTSNMLELNYPLAYNDEYLCRIARAGYTGFHLDLECGLFAHSKVLPELNRADSDRQLEILRQIVAKSRRYALEVYITFYSTGSPTIIPCSFNIPGVRGSRIINCQDRHILCSSHELTRCFYNEQLSGSLPGRLV